MVEATPEELRTKRMIIYMIKNKVNGKVYIGQTTRTFNERYRGKGIGAERVLNHYITNVGGGMNAHLKNALEKNGTENFNVYILFQCCDVNELNEKEEYYIEKYDSCNNENGYNKQSGGFNRKRNRDIVEQTVRKINKTKGENLKNQKKEERKLIKEEKLNRDCKLNGITNITLGRIVKVYDEEIEFIKTFDSRVRRTMFSIIVYMKIYNENTIVINRRDLLISSMYVDKKCLKTKCQTSILKIINKQKEIETIKTSIDEIKVIINKEFENKCSFFEIDVSSVPIAYNKIFNDIDYKKCKGCNVFIFNKYEKNSRSYRFGTYCEHCEKTLGIYKEGKRGGSHGKSLFTKKNNKNTNI